MPLDPPSIPSWVWTAVPPVVTFVVGMFVKPMSELFGKVLNGRRDRKRLRKALYRELGANFERMHLLVIHRNQPEQQNEFPKVEEWERREVYDHALKNEPIVFRELKEASFVSDFYMQLQRMRAADARGQHEMIVALNKAIADQVRRKRLSRGELKASYLLMGPAQSPYQHPMMLWLRRWIARISSRNNPKAGSYIYRPQYGKVRAFITGRTGVPVKYAGPPLVGDPIFGPYRERPER